MPDFMRSYASSLGAFAFVPAQERPQKQYYHAVLFTAGTECKVSAGLGQSVKLLTVLVTAHTSASSDLRPARRLVGRVKY